MFSLSRTTTARAKKKVFCCFRRCDSLLKSVPTRRFSTTKVRQSCTTPKARKEKAHSSLLAPPRLLKKRYFLLLFAARSFFQTSLHLPIRDEIALLATSVGESLPSSRNSLSDSCCESTSSSEELVNLKKARDIDTKNVHKDKSAVQEMYPRILPNSLGASTPNRRHCPG